MSKTLTLNLSAKDIKLAVKSDTYITGQIDKASDMVKNAARAFNEQAGDEAFHDAKLYRTMKGALAKFEAAIAEYVETSLTDASVTDTLTPAADTFAITLNVNDRTSGAFVTTLCYLAQEYIINMMLYYWWQPITPSLAKDYLTFAADNIADVRRCLSKTAPSSSEISYSDISGTITSHTTDNRQGVTIFYGNPNQVVTLFVGNTRTLTATITPAGLPVTYTSSDTSVATVDENGLITAVAPGYATITASFEGNSQYTPASDTQLIRVTSVIEHGGIAD